MNALHDAKELTTARLERGFTLVELMVTVAIAVFLLFGLVTIVDNVRRTYTSQQQLAQLQDQQRFAMTILTDVIQNGGFLSNPITYTPASFTATGPWLATAAFTGTHTTGTPGGPDTIGVRYLAGPTDHAIQCDGSDSNQGAATVYANTFSIVGGQLMCSVNGAAAVPLVTNVTNMVVYFGVKRNATNDYNVDTYLTADQMCATCGPSASSDWTNISSVMVILYFTNPLQTTQTIAFQRVIEVMARAGVHT